MQIEKNFLLNSAAPAADDEGKGGDDNGEESDKEVEELYEAAMASAQASATRAPAVSSGIVHPGRGKTTTRRKGRTEKAESVAAVEEAVDVYIYIYIQLMESKIEVLL